MKRLTVLFAILALFGAGGIARADPVYVYDGVLGTWSDVNKTSVNGSPDSLMCWAAAASNVLAWTGWYGWDSATSSLLNTANQIYGAFDAAWTNRTGAPTFAYEWWMTDRTQSVIVDPVNGPYVFDTAGQNFYPGVDVQEGASVTAFIKPINSVYTLPDWLNTYVTADRGIVMSIDVPCPASFPAGACGPDNTYSHAVTVWGYDAATNQIYITDSDDGLTNIVTYTYFQSPADGNWYISGYTNLYTNPTSALVTQLTRLNRNDTGIEPNHGPVAGVPEPSTLILLGAGLCGLAFSRRRVIR